jgi:hypothetical protein
VRTVAAPEHPLVIFLDDSQWADLSSLQLMERLLSDLATHHLLVIGAYRDNEVSDTHPLFSTVAGCSCSRQRQASFYGPRRNVGGSLAPGSGREQIVRGGHALHRAA